MKIQYFRPQRRRPKPAPKIFGREDTISKLVDLFTDTESHAVVFGLGGIGKTSVALNVAHHPNIVNKFPQRLFYECHHDTTINSFASGLLHLFGKDSSPQINPQDSLLEFRDRNGPKLFLIVDNFESVWYHDNDSERFIQELAGIPRLTLLITTRSRSFFAIQTDRSMEPIHLLPVSEEASREIFLQFPSNRHYAEDPSLPVLLGDGYLAGYPLVIHLVAATAANSPLRQSIEQIMATWKKSQFEGHIKGSPQQSLAATISLSTTSPLITGTEFALDLLLFMGNVPSKFDVDEFAKCGVSISEAVNAVLLASIAQLGNHFGKNSIELLPPVADYFRAHCIRCSTASNSTRSRWDYLHMKSITYSKICFVARLSVSMNLSEIVTCGYTESLDQRCVLVVT